MKLLGLFLIKLGLRLQPLTPDSHKSVEPIVNGWVDKLNKVWWRPK